MSNNEYEYEDFELRIEPDDRGYRARVVHSPAGQASSCFELASLEAECEDLLSEIGRPRRGLRSMETVELEAIQRFGGALFDTVLDGEVAQVLRESQSIARQGGAGLRWRLRLSEVPQLAALPWEFLYDRRADRFPALSVASPLVRYLELPTAAPPLSVTPPIRVLVVAASPRDYSSIGIEAEWRGMRDSLDPLVRRGRLEIDRLEPPILAALEEWLDRGVYHVLHFIGHGAFSAQRDDGLLVLADENGKGRPVDSRRLGTLLQDHPSLRLAVLNACEGARGSLRDPFSGVAQTLARQQIQAVVGMQFEVPDGAAITFSTRFYQKLAQGWPIEAAVAAGRKALYLDDCELEWGAPVIYLRSPDGRLFDLPPDPNGDRETPERPAPAPPPRRPQTPPELTRAEEPPIDHLIARLVARGQRGVLGAYALAGALQLAGALGFAGLLFIASRLRETDSHLDNPSVELPILLVFTVAALAGSYLGYHAFGRALARYHSRLGRLALALLTGAAAVLALTVALAAPW